MNDKDIDDPIIEILPLINHSVRIDIIRLVYKESRSFTDLLKHLSIESTSKLSFHLNKLASLIEKNQVGNYELTELGMKTYNLVLAFEDDKLLTKSVSIAKKDDDTVVNINFTIPTIKNFLYHTNPSLFILILAFLTNLIGNLVLGRVLDYNSLYFKPDFPFSIYYVIWFLIVYIPVISYLVICYYYRFPLKYSLIGGVVTLAISFFFLKNSIAIFMNRSGFLGENQSNFLKVAFAAFHDLSLPFQIEDNGINIFEWEGIPLLHSANIAFILALLIFSLFFILLIIPLRKMSIEKEFNSSFSHFYTPKWVKFFWKREVWIISGVLYVILSLIFGNITGGLTGTAIYPESSGIPPMTISIPHFMIPPLGYLVPRLSILVPISMIIYLCLQVDMISPLMKNIITIIGIIFYPFFQLIEYYEYEKKFADIFYSHAYLQYGFDYRDIQLFITGIDEFAFIRLLHLCLEIIMITAVIALLIKFIKWGSQFKKADLEKYQIEEQKKLQI